MFYFQYLHALKNFNSFLAILCAFLLVPENIFSKKTRAVSKKQAGTLPLLPTCKLIINHFSVFRDFGLTCSHRTSPAIAVSWQRPLLPSFLISAWLCKIWSLWSRLTPYSSQRSPREWRQRTNMSTDPLSTFGVVGNTFSLSTSSWNKMASKDEPRN